MKLHHAFSGEYAALYGIREAILIHYFQYWIEYNKKLKRNLREGRTWIEQAKQEICAFFIFMSPDEISETIKSLIEKEIILEFSFGNDLSNQTFSYAFKNENEFLS